MIYKKLKTYVPKQIKLAYLGILFAVAAAFFTVGSYYYLYRFLQTLIIEMDLTNAITMAVYVAAFLIINVVVYFLAVYTTHRLAFRLETNLKKQGLKHLMKASASFYDKNESGRIRKIIDDNTALTHISIAHLIPDLTTAIFTPLFGIGLTFYVDLHMGILFAVSFLTGVVFIQKMSGDRDFFDAYMAASDKMNSGAVEYVRGIHVMKIFNSNILSFKEFYRSITSYGELAFQYSMSCRDWYVLFQIFYNVVFLITLFLGYRENTNALIHLTKFLYYALFNGVLYAALNKVMYLSMYVFQASSSIKKIETLFDQMKTNKPQSGTLYSMDRFSIEFDNVTFSYESQNVIEHLSFKLEENKTYALVGPSGSGKSTLVKLISGFYSLDEGHIRIGGKDITSYSEKALMHNIANVFQDAKLFKKSIYENVLLGKPDASYEEVMEALRLAQCTSILEKLEDRENTVIGTKGVHLSGGEIQRIAIARAILKNAKIVILDEASAATDPENEYELQQAFSNLMKDKTVIMIAHRLSTIINVDEILVIDHGKIIERGNHRQLMADHTTYRKLQLQFSQANEWKVSE